MEPLLQWDAEEELLVSSGRRWRAWRSLLGQAAFAGGAADRSPGIRREDFPHCNVASGPREAGSERPASRSREVFGVMSPLRYTGSRGVCGTITFRHRLR